MMSPPLKERDRHQGPTDPSARCDHSASRRYHRIPAEVALRPRPARQPDWRRGKPESEEDKRRAAFRFLCECLSWVAGRQIRDDFVRDGFSWASLVGLAQEYRVAGAVGWALEDAGLAGSAPAGVAEFFCGAARYMRDRNTRIRAQAVHFADLLNDVGIVPVFLKGGAHLLDGLYPDLSVRHMSDLDLLVPAARRKDALAVLTSRGFVAQDDGVIPPTRHDAPLSRWDWPVPVELHDEVIGQPYEHMVSAERIRAAAVVQTIDGADMAVPSPTDALIHNVAHAQLLHRDWLYGVVDFRRLLDVACLAARDGERIDWEKLDRTFKSWRHSVALSHHLQNAETLLGAAVPEEFLANCAAAQLGRRAMRNVGRPGSVDRNWRYLFPLAELVSSLSGRMRRQRLARNLVNRAWWKRRLAALRGR